MKLDEVRRLGSLTWQLNKHMRHLDSVQRRILALLAEANLPARDSELTDEALGALERAAVTALMLLSVMRDQLAAARQASDKDTGIDDKENMNQ